MLNNFFRALRGGTRYIPFSPSKVFGVVRKAYSYFGVVPLLRILPDFGINQKVVCRAQLPVLHRNQTCKYVSSKCHNLGLEIQGNYLIFKGKRYPVVPLISPDKGPVVNVQGHRLYAINTAGTNYYKDFESKSEENKVLVVAYDGRKCVDPVVKGGNRDVFLSTEQQVYPFSFSVRSYETGQTDLLLSFLMLPLNVAGLAVGCVCRLSSSVLLGIAHCANSLSGYLAEKVDKKIMRTSSGVLSGTKKPYFLTSLIFLLSIVGNCLTCCSTVLKGAGNFAEAVIRFPSSITNAIHNSNMRCLAMTAGVAAVNQSAKSLFLGLKDSGVDLVKTCVLCKARLCGDEGTLRKHVSEKYGFILNQKGNREESMQEDEQSQQRRKISRKDLNQITQLGGELSKEILCGTKQDISREISKQRKTSTKAV
ncbi:hypothetical protein [Ehrlichia japonica]|uniref:Uncharacterized protein n=1 Tax=Ehrlichia japonica TaxID=391036 RepID=X5GC65_9RICK|nr:hypothetical protein [Ehrlichia japonica]AHX04692.1 hypothetical protein EHF_0801 [Ehrlichia japonica]